MTKKINIHKIKKKLTLRNQVFMLAKFQLDWITRKELNINPNFFFQQTSSDYIIEIVKTYVSFYEYYASYMNELFGSEISFVFIAD